MANKGYSDLNPNVPVSVVCYPYGGHYITIKNVVDQYGELTVSFIDERIFRAYPEVSYRVNNKAEFEAREIIDYINHNIFEREFGKE